MPHLKQKLKSAKRAFQGLALLFMATATLLASTNLVAFAATAPSQGGGTLSGTICPAGSTADSQGSCKCPDGSTAGSSGCKCPPGTEPDGKGKCQDSAITCNTDQCDLINKYLDPAIKLFAALFGAIAAISIAAAGVQYTASGGDPQKVAAAKKRVINTIIAIFAFIFLYAFLQFLIPGGIFGRPTGA